MTSELDRLCDTTPRVTITTKYGAPAPADPNWKPAHAWTVTLRRDGRQITTPFYGGSPVSSPPSADVLSSLIMDAGYGEYDFEEFCSELGYDTDSRRALATWRACLRTAGRVRRFLGDDFERYARAEH